MRLGTSSPICMESAEKWAKTQLDLGCRAVVFPLNSDADEKDVKAYADAARTNDITIAEVGIWRNAIAVDEAERKANLEYSIKQLELADRIGAKCCVNVAGSTGKIWDGGYKENFNSDTWAKTVKMIQTIIDEVKPKNTFFTLEPMPWMVPSGPREYRHLIEDVARDEFAVHMDIINMITSPERYFFHEEFMEETFTLLGSKIKSCHLKDIKLLPGYTFQLKECGCGEGDFNLEKYAALVNACDKDMPLIIEHLSSDEAYVKSVAYVTERFKKGGVM